VRLFGVLNCCFAAFYAAAGFWLIPARGLPFRAALTLLVTLLVFAGAGLIGGAKWGRTLARAVAWLQLAYAVVLIGLLLASAAYLKGVYADIGRGMAALCLVAVALIVEAVALWPIFLLWRLHSRAGDRSKLEAV
jgi:hypothetical protein